MLPIAPRWFSSATPAWRARSCSHGVCLPSTPPCWFASLPRGLASWWKRISPVRNRGKSSRPNDPPGWHVRVLYQSADNTGTGKISTARSQNAFFDELLSEGGSSSFSACEVSRCTTWSPADSDRFRHTGCRSLIMQPRRTIVLARALPPLRHTVLPVAPLPDESPAAPRCQVLRSTGPVVNVGLRTKSAVWPPAARHRIHGQVGPRTGRVPHVCRVSNLSACPRVAPLSSSPFFRSPVINFRFSTLKPRCSTTIFRPPIPQLPVLRAHHFSIS